MPDKRRERAYVERFLRGIDGELMGSIIEGEAPDFVIASDTGLIGIEFTTFHVAPAAGELFPQEQLRLRWRIVRSAEGLHEVEGGLPVYAHIRFRPRTPLRKARIRPLVRQLCDAVQRKALPVTVSEELELGYEDGLPPEIVSVALRGSINGRDKLWQPTFSDWVRRVSPGQVQQVIDQKNKRASSYRQDCSAIWLVLVNDVFVSGQALELGDDAAVATYVSRFERVYWLGDSDTPYRMISAAA
jgi:hypothetical protein